MLNSWTRIFPALHWPLVACPAMSKQQKPSLETRKSGVKASPSSVKTNRLAVLAKGAWALFVTLQVIAAGWLFLILFYVFLAFVGSLFGRQFAIKEWSEVLGESAAPAAWLLLGFLTARLLSQVSLDLQERARKGRCPACGVELTPATNVGKAGKAAACLACGRKL